MFTLLDTLRQLVGTACRGAFVSSEPAAVHRVPAANLIYRLRSWPDLPEAGRTAEVYRMLSIMSNRPVNRQWVLTHTRMNPRRLEALLQQLVAEGCIEVIDPARFAGRDALQVS